MSIFKKKLDGEYYEQNLAQIFSEFSQEEKDESFCTLAQTLFQKGLLSTEEIEAVFNWEMIVEEEK